MSTNQLFTWRRQAREGKLSIAEHDVAFVPAIIAERDPDLAGLEARSRLFFWTATPSSRPNCPVDDSTRGPGSLRKPVQVLGKAIDLIVVTHLGIGTDLREEVI